MKVNEIYRCPALHFPEGPLYEMAVIRKFDENSVTFSVAADEQPRLTEGVIRFNLSTFTLSRPAFTELFEFVDTGDPAVIGGIT